MALFRFLLNPASTCDEFVSLWRFLGILFGVAIRTKKPLDLHLAPCIWKVIAGIQLTVEDLEEVECTFFSVLLSLSSRCHCLCVSG